MLLLPWGDGSSWARMHLRLGRILIMLDTDLRTIMYALTLADRPAKRALWLTGGFKKMNARGNDALFAYWRKRLDASSKDATLTQKVWNQYQKYLSEPQPAKVGSPSLLQKAKNLTGAVINEAVAVAKGAPPVTPGEKAARLAICAGCPSFIEATTGNRCAQCGCFLSAKTSFRSSTCPAGKWGIV